MTGTNEILTGMTRRDLLFLAACAVYLYLTVFLFPGTPIFIENDHTALLNDALRMYNGEVIYRDFFEFTFPGAASVYFVLFKLFGPSFWILDAVIVLIGMCGAFVCLWASKKMLGNTVYAYAAAAIYVFVGFRWFGIDGEHRMMSPIFAALSALPLVGGISFPRVAAAGAFCAASTFFTQQRGVAALFAVGLFLLFEVAVRERKPAQFISLAGAAIGSFVVVLLTLLLPFLISAGPATFYESTIGFLSHYVKDPATNSLATYVLTIKKIASIGAIYTAVAAFYYLLIPAVYIAAAIFFWRNRSVLTEKARRGLLLFTLLGLALAAGTPAPNAERLFQISLPAVIVFAFLISRLKFVTAKLVAAIIIGVMCFGMLLGIRTQTAWQPEIIAGPHGKMAFLTPEVAERYLWLAAHTRPGDAVYEVYNAQVNFPLGLRNPSAISVMLNTPYNPPDQFARSLADIQREQPRFIVWDGVWTREMQTQSDHERLKPFYLHMKEYYFLKQKFTPYDGREREVWQLKSAAE